jgi:hypothetical protein
MSLAVPLAARSTPAASAPVLQKISTKAPAWYTRAVQQKVIAAGAKGYHIPSGFTMPAAAGVAFVGIRPGHLILIFSADGTTISLCTSNFVFRNGANYAIGTAGHCGGVGDQVSMLTAPRVLVDIGIISKSTGDAGIGNDFALISINPALNRLVSPSMAFWGGPTAAYPGPKVPSLIKHIGWGAGIGAGGTPRVGVGIYYSPTAYTFIGVIAPGDSGSGAEAGNGQAVGNITHISVAINDGRGLTHTAAGTSIQRILQIAGLPLATCSTVPWPGYRCPPKL